MRTLLTRSILVVGGSIILSATASAKTFVLTIRFIPPSSGQIEAKCEAITSVPRLAVSVHDHIKWKLKRDDDAKCVDFDADAVKLDFNQGGVVDDDSGKKGGQYVLGHSHFFGGDAAQGTVVGGVGVIKYKVLLNDKVAQDPELDVSGTVTSPIK